MLMPSMKDKLKFQEDTVSILTYRQPIVISTDGPDCVPRIPCGEGTHALRLGLCLLGVFRPGEVGQITRMILAVGCLCAVHGHQDVQLDIACDGQRFFDGPGILCETIGAMRQTWAWDDSGGGSTESSILDFKAEDLARHMGDDRVGRCQVDPRACVDEQLGNDLAGSERCVRILEGGDERQSLHVTIRRRLGVGAQHTQHTRVEVVVSDGRGQHIVLRATVSLQAGLKGQKFMYSQILGVVDQLGRHRQRPLGVVLADIPHGQRLGHAGRVHDQREV